MVTPVSDNDGDSGDAMTSADSAIAEALWSKVIEDVTATKAHEAFVSHCQQCDQLQEAARRYREHRDGIDEADEETRELITKRLGGIATVAMAQLDAQRTDPHESRMLRVLQFIIAVRTQPNSNAGKKTPRRLGWGMVSRCPTAKMAADSSQPSPSSAPRTR